MKLQSEGAACLRIAEQETFVMRQVVRRTRNELFEPELTPAEDKGEEL